MTSQSYFCSPSTSFNQNLQTNTENATPLLYNYIEAACNAFYSDNYYKVQHQDVMVKYQ